MAMLFSRKIQPEKREGVCHQAENAKRKNRKTAGAYCIIRCLSTALYHGSFYK